MDIKQLGTNMDNVDSANDIGPLASALFKHIQEYYGVKDGVQTKEELQNKRMVETTA